MYRLFSYIFDCSRRMFGSKTLQYCLGVVVSSITLTNIAFAQTATVNLSWTVPTDTTGITQYRIYVRPAGGTYPTTTSYVANGAATATLAISNLNAGSYFFIAKSFNGTQESDPSNEVAITAVPALLEGRTATQISGRVFNVKAFNVGQTSSPLVNVDCTANASGILTIPTGQTGLPANFDLRLKSTGYLAKRTSNRSLNATSSLVALLAGDLNVDPNPAATNTINSFDYGVIKSNWFGSNANADFNGDGIVNGLDYNLVKKNWFLSDDL
jgi:hypothetical protein